MMLETSTHRALVAIALLLLTLGPLAAETGNGLPGLEGGRLTEESLAEGDTIVVVWASWSPRGRNLGARVAAIADRWGERARVITVNFQEEPERARRFVRSQKVQVPVFLDREARFAKRHAVTSLPFLLVFESGETAFAGKLPADVDTVLGRVLGEAGS
jgi:thiol-disulfide isomerase/thioredoxin